MTEPEKNAARREIGLKLVAIWFFGSVFIMAMMGLLRKEQARPIILVAVFLVFALNILVTIWGVRRLKKM
ncbi:MAG: hypothetical protein HYT49_02620 [Candidatus Wildermuthbacteria bacterium]|nr:hypothetical protein [Candidatus Wildermuthbacteria bacterium]